MNHLTAESPLKIVYIAGNGRSGSTLLARMLGQIDGFESIGELKHIWLRNFQENQLCGCGTPFQYCPFWTTVIDEAFGGMQAVDGTAMRSLQMSVDRNRFIPQIKWAPSDSAFGQQRQAYEEVLSRLYAAISHAADSRIIVDSSKEVSTLFLLDRLPGIELYVVHLLRDSRGVAYSWSRKKVRPEITDRVVYMHVHSPFKTAQRWLGWNSAIEAGFAGRGKPHYLRLRYEDIVNDPAAAVREIVTVAGHPQADLSFITGSEVHFTRTDHTVAGNPNRFQQGTSVAIRFDEAWKEKMSAGDRRVVTAVTWPLLVKYGYLP